MDINRAITQLLRNVNAVRVIEGIKDLEDCDLADYLKVVTSQ